MIQFIVNRQKLSLAGKPYIVGNTKDYLEAAFDFSDDWNGAAKIAYFKQGDQVYQFLLENDKLTADKHLNLTSGEWEVWLYGFDADIVDVSNLPDSVARISTNVIYLYVEDNGGTDGTPVEIEPVSLGEQILSAAHSAVNTANAVKAAADAGEFKGDAGNDGHSPVVTASKSGKVTTIKVDGTTVATINDGTNGTNGSDGYTPVRGTDYWTSADQQAIVSDTIAALPKYTGGVS